MFKEIVKTRDIVKLDEYINKRINTKKLLYRLFSKLVKYKWIEGYDLLLSLKNCEKEANKKFYFYKKRYEPYMHKCIDFGYKIDKEIIHRWQMAIGAKYFKKYNEKKLEQRMLKEEKDRTETLISAINMEQLCVSIITTRLV